MSWIMSVVCEHTAFHLELNQSVFGVLVKMWWASVNVQFVKSLLQTTTCLGFTIIMVAEGNEVSVCNCKFIFLPTIDLSFLNKSSTWENSIVACWPFLWPLHKLFITDWPAKGGNKNLGKVWLPNACFAQQSENYTGASELWGSSLRSRGSDCIRLMEQSLAIHQLCRSGPYIKQFISSAMICKHVVTHDTSW